MDIVDILLTVAAAITFCKFVYHFVMLLVEIRKQRRPLE